MDNQQKITEIEEILDAGASKVTVDGITTEFDFEQLRKRKSELEAAEAKRSGRRNKTPRVATIDLRNAF